jgi:hypothetical protein
MRRTLPALLGLLALAPAAAAAQVLRGTVVEEGTRAPVAGGLIQLLRDSTTVAAAATNEHGRFVLPAIAPGSYRLRVLRIGFQPWTSPVLALAAGQRRDDSLAVPSVPVILDELTVEASSPCRSSPLEDRRLALLWDEVRTSLGILEAAASDSLEFRHRLIRRRVDALERLAEQESRQLVGTGRWPVSTQPAESLARMGYVQPRDTLRGPVYYGPDATAFFSDPFLTTHCFRLAAAPAGDEGLIGVGFEPVRGRRTIDIAGTLWIDRRTRELRSLEYRYAGLWDWVPKGSAGGALTFARLATGQVVIVGWAIRAPIAQIDPLGTGHRREDERTRPFFGTGRVVSQGYREEVGEVEDVRGPDGRVLWQRQAAGR